VYDDFRRLADLRIAKETNRLAQAEADEVRRIQASAGQRGIDHKSGVIQEELYLAYCARYREKSEAVAAIWTELIRQHGRLDEDARDFILDQVLEVGERWVESMPDRLDGSRAADSARAQWARTQVVLDIRRDLQIAAEEAKLREEPVADEKADDGQAQPSAQTNINVYGSVTDSSITGQAGSGRDQMVVPPKKAGFWRKIVRWILDKILRQDSP
jgi:hypothetical protein